MSSIFDEIFDEKLSSDACLEILHRMPFAESVYGLRSVLNARLASLPIDNQNELKRGLWDVYSEQEFPTARLGGMRLHDRYNAIINQLEKTHPSAFTRGSKQNLTIGTKCFWITSLRKNPPRPPLLLSSSSSTASSISNSIPNSTSSTISITTTITNTNPNHNSNNSTVTPTYPLYMLCNDIKQKNLSSITERYPSDEHI